MKITEKKIQDLAKLAKLCFSEKEVKNMFLDFSKMLDFIEQLDQVNTESIAPLTHIHEKTNIYRKDVAINSEFKRSMLKQSANHNSDYIKVPKIINKN
ncbi:MAG: Asp-tRNA(Asn)/Glu-tRNA(Gln) amidotransferase GatCAB subunit C [Flavobacteriales bacterium]|nr:Asp-tRNA(Asn)/Glu-tRNA(Gln) amidotransferase GatCAB subunit C [Flavobacteriales bacterium]|tara:strand:- start:206 stop:499 length:294 start_codon:yes stop_codon:yes gene_type:complete